MIQLRTLGGLSVEREGRVLDTFLEQRRGLALLAVLAVAGDTGVRRERIGLLFWPESDAPHASGATKQLIYTVRRSLGPPPPLLGTSHLRLNPEVVASDVVRFRDLLAEARLEEAVGVYRGPFLDGFHLSRAAEFERWVDEQRSHLRAMFLESLETLARRADEGGERLASCRWWRKLAVADPLNGRARLGLMQALARAGDPAGAMQEARRFARVLDEELEVGLPEEVAELAEQLGRSLSSSASPMERPFGGARRRPDPEGG